MKRPSAEKRKAFDLLWLEAPTFFVQAVPAMDGVALPAHLMREAVVLLAFGKDLPVPITDLHVNRIGFAARLSFDRAPFYVRVPWASVSAIARPDEDGKIRGWQWTVDAPPAREDSSVRPLHPSERSYLRRVK